MAITIEKIARLAGVSRGTVDRALNDRGRINPEVQKRIKEIAAKEGYVKRQRSLTPAGKIIKIGVVTQLAEASFMIQIRKGLADAVRELKVRGIEVYLEECTTVDEGEQLRALERLTQRAVAGIAIMPVEGNRVRDKLNDMAEKGIKILTFNTDIVGTRRECFVGMDNRKSGRTAAGLIAALTRKEGQVLAITGHFGNSVNNMRVEGFTAELKENFKGIHLIGVQSSFDERKEVEKIVCSGMKSFPQLQGIAVFSSGQEGVNRALAQLKPKVRPYVIVYDLTPQNIRSLLEDKIDFLIEQNGYMQGYRVLYVLADLLQGIRKPDREFYFTDIIIKTKYNL